MRAYDPYVPMETVPGQVNSLEVAVDGADIAAVLMGNSELSKL